MTDRNQYAPPTAVVRDAADTVAIDADMFMPEGRACPASAGWHWYGTAWRIFKASPLNWWLVLLLAFGLFIGASFIPLVNVLATVAFPIVVAGMGSCARSAMQEGRFEVVQLFDGFKRRPGTLMLAGVLYLVAMVLCLGVVMLAFSASGLTSMFLGGMSERHSAARHLFGSMGGGFLLAYFVAIGVGMSTIVFAPYLIQEQGMSAVQAVRVSTKACFKNIPASLVAVLSYFALAIAATIPIGLGWLVLLPVISLIGYVAYRDIFYA